MRRNINKCREKKRGGKLPDLCPNICYNTLPDVRESGFQNPENFYLYVKIELTTKNFACRIRNPGRGDQNPRLLDSLTWGETPAYPESRKLDLLDLTSICPCIMSTVNKLKVTSQSTNLS